MSRKIFASRLFVIAVAASLGFGATQAFAAPAVNAGSERACDAAADASCNAWCKSNGWDFGWCDPGWDNGCHCTDF